MAIRLHTRRMIVAACALACLQPAPAKGAVIETAAALAALGTAAWQVGLFIGGARADAYALADGTWDSDPAGITPQDLRNGKGGFVGGFFNSSAFASASADGALGSHMKTTAETSLGLFAFSGKVDVSDHKLGTAPGAVYWGSGAASGADRKRITKSLPLGPSAAQETVAVPFSTALTVTRADLFAMGPAHPELDSPRLMDTRGVDAAFVRMVAYVTLGDSFDIADAIWSQTLVDTSAILIDGSVPTLLTTGGVFTASAFGNTVPSGSGIATGLLAPIMLPIEFSAMVPADVSTFNLVLSTDIGSSTGALVPEPAMLGLVVPSLFALYCRHARARRRPTST